MDLTCFAFNSGNALPPRYMGAINPPLAIGNVPAQTKSLAIVMHDPDGVSGDFTHWAMWDIAPDTTGILENVVPTGATVGLNSAGKLAYMGPKPPAGSGRHHYTFVLYALNTKLDMFAHTKPAGLQSAMAPHIITTATLIGVIDA